MVVTALSPSHAPLETPAAIRATGAAVRIWLWLVAALVLAMVTVGGATRLTGSGLSITEWQPILGAIPPLTDADWMIAFDKYRQIAQYKLLNKGMSLEAFQFIYWWEWGHRQLGRFIGLAYGLPLVWFWWRGMIPRGYGPALVGLLALGGLQGAIGWYMVQSGLTDRVAVSQYRLALHLTVAAFIFAGLVWVALSLERLPTKWLPGSAQQTRPSTTRSARRDGRHASVPGAVRGLSAAILVLLFGQIAAGALVAGMKAGLAHNTWPLMDGQWVPDGLLIMQPTWINAFENAMTVQFNHRMLAYLVVVLVLTQAWLVARGVDDPRVTRTAWVLLAATLVQVAFGIWTLLAHVPLWLGLVHQATAFLLLGAAVWHRWAVVETPVNA
jgi:cytochrome c oxidase assembly protein subunit 15